MSNIFGHLNVSDGDYVFNATAGQMAIYEAAAAYVAARNAQLQVLLGVFVARTTSDYKLRYKMPGGGYLQERQADGRYGAGKAYGDYDVAFPLRDFGAMIAGNDVDMAYMTAAELSRHIDNIIVQNVNTVRLHLMHRLLDNVEETFVDPRWGSLSIEPLANGDSVTYMPVEGSTTEATEDHYYGSAYAYTSISDTNDPWEDVIVPELVEHFGIGNATPIISFIPTGMVPYVTALADVVDAEAGFIREGTATAVAMGPGMPYPGRLVGRHRGGAWIVEWPWVPTGYIISTHLGVEAPIVRRIDPADTGLGDGLQLVATNEQFPFSNSVWRHRFGFGCGNRLNGHIFDAAAADSTYSIPSGYD